MSRLYALTFPQVIGFINGLLGLGHAAAPWVLGYADIGRAQTGDVIAGLVLAVFGFARFLGAGAWANIACFLVGLWILAAPAALRYGSTADLRLGWDAFSAVEALWVGWPVMILAFCSAIDTWLPRRGAPAEVAH